MTSPLDAVAALMLERQRIEQWLAGMEAKRPITPPHVYERVRGDYERRLAEVTAQLTGRAGEVQGSIGALTERLARLQGEERALRDESYAAELRAAVGEFTPDQWEALIRDSDARIARVVGERAGVSTELTRLHQVLSMAAALPTAARSSAAPARASEGKRGFDELEFLKSVVGKERAADGRGSGPSPAGAAVPATAPAAVAPVLAPLARPDPAPVSRQREPEQSTEEAAPAVEESAEVPAFLKDVPQEAQKTLKCTACGTMNFATEWYCERCGGEMAAM
ncbi:MAG TPA: Ran-binding zinc finger domain-containing protein [Gemmatimonadaceae bacterium]|nr:Ran-binding zinc finger domain-containing protein [Gemmatimonadaceae bacterium]